MKKVVPYSSDTDLTPFDTGAYASSTTYVSGNAVKRAAEKMKHLIVQHGSKLFNCSEEEVVFNGEEIIGPEQRLPLSEFATKLYYSENQTQLCSTASFVGDEAPPPYMSAFCEIELDTETGKITPVRYVAVVDCGVPINPNLAKVQVEGALVQGIGMALYEEVKYDSKGRLMTNSMMNYRIPSRLDIGDIEVHFVESYEPTGPYGAKSVAEIGIDTPPAAISNAVYNAVGIRLHDLPFTPEKVLKALRVKEGF